MRTPLQGLLWELWRLSSWKFLVRAVGAGILGCSLLSALAPWLKVPMWALSIVYLLILTSCGIGSSVWIPPGDALLKRGFPYRQSFIRPLGTRTLVIVPFVYGALAAGMAYLIPALALRLAFGIPLPLLSMFCLLLLADAFITAAIWIPRSNVTLYFSLTAVILILGWGLIRLLKLFADLLESTGGVFQNADNWPALFPLQYATVAVLFLILLAATVWSVNRQRHGETVRLPRFRKPSTQPQSGTRRQSLRPFKSRLAAQAWMELRRTALPSVALAPVMGTVAFAICFAAELAEELGPGQGPALWTCFLFLTLVAVLGAGAHWTSGLRFRGTTGYLSTFEATQPTSTGRQIAIKYCVLLACALASAVVIAAMAVLWTLSRSSLHDWVGYWGQGLGQTLSRTSPWARLTVGASALLTLLSAPALTLAAAYWIAAKQKEIVFASTVAFINCLLLFVDIFQPWSLQPFWNAEAWIIALGLLAYCLLALYRGLKRQYISPGVFTGAAGLWLAYLGLLWQTWSHIPDAHAARIPGLAIAMLAALLLVPLASIAFAPLALASNRHR